jgi:hypothetical protein
MTMQGNFGQQPVECLDYDLDYSKWLNADDEILSFKTLVTPDEEGGLKVARSYNNNPRIKLYLDGGKDGSVYKVEVTITTRDDRVKQDEFKIKVKEI